MDTKPTVTRGVTPDWSTPMTNEERAKLWHADLNTHSDTITRLAMKSLNEMRPASEVFDQPIRFSENDKD